MTVRAADSDVADSAYALSIVRRACWYFYTLISVTVASLPSPLLCESKEESIKLKSSHGISSTLICRDAESYPGFFASCCYCCFSNSGKNSSVGR